LTILRIRRIFHGRFQIRCATARCLAQLGFTQTSSVCFDALSDIMMLYLKKFSSCVQYYVEQRGRTTPCLTDVKRALDYMRVSRHELYEYMRQVRPMEPVLPVLPFLIILL
ncbi:bromodomain associated, partial [Ancylostoma caninum]